MTRPKVLATRPLFPAAQEILNASCDVDYWSRPERISKEELFRGVADREGLVCLLTERVNEELLRAAPKLRRLKRLQELKSLAGPVLRRLVRHSRSAAKRSAPSLEIGAR